ncbi:MAG TPA: hypothetical protein VGK67_41075 [Myxococcales bacterium]|jgi:hypothetical protein
MKPLLALLPCLAVVASLASCAPKPYEKIVKEDSAEALARYLRENPKDPQAPRAKARLAELEFQQARRQNTVLSYKRFMDSFPDSERKKDALVMLEGLRFETAARADTSVAWNEFLRDHPAGVHVAEAKEKLAEADFREAVAEGSAKALEEFVLRHPQSPRRMETDRLVDDRRYAEAKQAGARGLVAYLEKNPAGLHREEARGGLAAREAAARSWLGDYEAARPLAELIPDAAARAKALEEIDAAELDEVTARLDPKALEAFATRRGPGAAAEQARARAKALAKDRAGALKALADRLDPSHFARNAEELVRVLAAQDPRDRWLAAEELGRMGARGAVDALLDAAAASRFHRVRTRAFEALQALFDYVPPETRELDVRRRMESLRKLAQTPELLVKLGMLEEVLGERVAASTDYQKCVSTDPSDLFVLKRLTALRLERKEGFGAAVSARELSTRVQMLVEQRSAEEGLSPLLLSRTLCGARDDARTALATMQNLPPEVARDFPEDLQSFVQRALETERLSSAKLADSELEARAANKAFKGCDDDAGLRDRLAEGETERLKVIAELAARPEEPARHALALTARRDPSPKVREAAQAALDAKKGAAAK